MDQGLEKVVLGFNGNTYQIFLDFMRRTATLDELADLGHRFLAEFHIHLESVRRPPFIKSSNLVEDIIKTNQNDRVKLYVEAGCKHVHHDVRSISKLHKCKQQLQDHIEKVKVLVNEIEHLAEDATGITRSANGIISDFLNGSSVDQIAQDPDSIVEEGVEPIHLRDRSILHSTMMLVVYRMFKLDYIMQEKIVESLNPNTSSSELECYCSMWDLHPYINENIMHQAWRLVS